MNSRHFLVYGQIFSITNLSEEALWRIFCYSWIGFSNKKNTKLKAWSKAGLVIAAAKLELSYLMAKLQLITTMSV